MTIPTVKQTICTSFTNVSKTIAELRKSILKSVKHLQHHREIQKTSAGNRILVICWDVVIKTNVTIGFWKHWQSQYLSSIFTTNGLILVTVSPFKIHFVILVAKDQRSKAHGLVPLWNQAHLSVERVKSFTSMATWITLLSCELR